MREITKDELMEEIVGIFAHNYLDNGSQLSFCHYTFSATPKIVRAYAERMVNMYREYDLCGTEIFRLIESTCFITVIVK